MWLLVPVVCLLVIACATALGPRLGVASPLLLVGTGVLVSLLPMMPSIAIRPELILAGVLPPLLYSASVAMPAMDFRRDFTAIGGLSVILVAAAQTLPVETPGRSLLVFIAFAVAAGSLAIQGGTLPWAITWVKPAPVDPELRAAEREALMGLLERVAVDVELKPGATLEMAVIHAQRDALLRARDHGVYGSTLLTAALASLDARQISLELDDGPAH